MENTGYSLSDIAAATKGLGSGEGGMGWLFLIIVILAIFNGGWGGNRGPAGPVIPPNVATQTDVQNAINNQAVNNGIQQVLLSSANNNYETAQLIAGQTSTMQQMNNTNQINIVQGFNTIASKIDSLSHHMDECCCQVKQTLMQQQLDEANRRLLEAQNKNNIAEQSQYLLGNMGRWVGWAGSGSASASAIAS